MLLDRTVLSSVVKAITRMASTHEKSVTEIGLADCRSRIAYVPMGFDEGKGLSGALHEWHFAGETSV